MTESNKEPRKQIGGDHYQRMAVQPVEFIQANDLGFLTGNVIKYVCRANFKNGREDILKAMHCLELILQLEYND